MSFSSFLAAPSALSGLWPSAASVEGGGDPGSGAEAPDLPGVPAGHQVHPLPESLPRTGVGEQQHRGRDRGGRGVTSTGAHQAEGCG